MPLTPDNSRHITWTAGTGTEWNLRWKLHTATAWNYYPDTLTTAEAYFAVVVLGDPYPPGTYVGVLNLANRYDVEVQQVCGPGSKSAWSDPYTFETFLACPVITSAPTFNVPDPTDHPEVLECTFTFDCKGSPIYPILELRYKESLSMVYTHIPYERDGTTLFITLPGPGTYSLILTSKCTDVAGEVVSPATIYTF